ncbi:MAG TPA: dihydrolipoyl dehydrogenase [Chloroflexota bacterium]|nr:dihydrolipoyl dehydrogenase [Chloroflexota bacterium]
MYPRFQDLPAGDGRLIEKDVAVIGAGPGGYIAAIRAAQLGASVVSIEEKWIGGVCLNVGCIPTKALIRGAELFATMKEAEKFGIKTGALSVDYPAMVKREQGIIRRNVSGIGALFKSNGIQSVMGRARFNPDKSLSVKLSDGGEEQVKARDVIVATGSSPSRPPLPGMDLPGVIDSTGALQLEEIPARLTIVGGGVIGVEFGCLFANLGSKVTIIEMLPSIVAQEDADVIKALDADLKKLGITILADTKLKEIKAAGSAQTCLVETKAGEQSIEGDVTLVATGRSPNTRDIGLDAVGVQLNRGWITVDDDMRTNVSCVFAVGDVNGRSLLAHAGFAQGVRAAEVILGHKSMQDIKLVPRCIYTIPEIAAVGMTEQQARETHTNVKVGRFPFSANGKALCVGDTTGFVKVVADAEYGEILGVHIYGHEASSQIMEGVLAMRLEAAVEDVYTTIHPHPTLTEAFGEAALAVDGIALHWPKGA